MVTLLRQDRIGAGRRRLVVRAVDDAGPADLDAGPIGRKHAALDVDDDRGGALRHAFIVPGIFSRMQPALDRQLLVNGDAGQRSLARSPGIGCSRDRRDKAHITRRNLIFPVPIKLADEGWNASLAGPVSPLEGVRKRFARPVPKRDGEAPNAYRGVGAAGGGGGLTAGCGHGAVSARSMLWN
jgi:hypothetical protein